MLALAPRSSAARALAAGWHAEVHEATGDREALDRAVALQSEAVAGYPTSASTRAELAFLLAAWKGKTGRPEGDGTETPPAVDEAKGAGRRG